MLDYIEYRKQKPEVFTKKIPCECGGSYTHWNKSRHLKQKKHLHFIETGEQFKPKTNAELIKLCRERKNAVLC